MLAPGLTLGSIWRQECGGEGEGVGAGAEVGGAAYLGRVGPRAPSAGTDIVGVDGEGRSRSRNRRQPLFRPPLSRGRTRTPNALLTAEILPFAPLLQEKL